MKKRIVSIMLALMAMVCLFAGCGGSGTATPAPTEAPATEAPAAPSEAPEAADPNEDWAYIANKGEMIIGITLFAPMNYEDENGDLTGFETEFAKAVCEELGVTPKFQIIDWKMKETELASKNIDCIWNGMTIDEERKANMDISTPYMSNKQVMVVKAENVEKFSDAANIAGAVVVAEQGSAGETVATTDAAFSGATYTPVAAQSNALLEVFSGTADMGIIDYVMSIGSIGEGTDYAELSVVESMGFAPEEYGIAFRKGSPETLTKVNDAIAKLAADGTLKEIAAKYKLDTLLLVG